MSNEQELPLRIGVGIILLNNENKVFVGRRIDNPENYWQMPQGGVDKSENYFNAAKRELEEESGIKSVKLIKEIDHWLEYDLPDYLLGKIWKGKYRGQKQKWYIMKFNGNDSEINIKTKKPEFLAWKWIDLNAITEVVVDFKLEVYRKIKKEVEKIINK